MENIPLYILEEVDLKPHPRILPMLGQIEFENWQCIAELIDNSIDALLKDFKNGRTDAGKIHVNIPSNSQYLEGHPITIWDNGPGMNLDQLENSLKAGYSGNDPIDNLGLFGMGFNISTARLGDSTEVITSNFGESEELCIKIDFQTMIKENSFKRPVLKQKKDNQYASGTSIKISKLKQRVSHLGQQGLSSLKKHLSRVYSKLLRDYDIEIYVNGDKLAPNNKCTWNPERFVIRNGSQIHARIEINEDLGAQYFCTGCWNWMDIEVIDGILPDCSVCNTSQHVLARERNITGWIGVQRYYDMDKYGIDFYRNGRLIVSNDKTLFYWRNPETAELELEYPVDATHWGGRIVGEIEANFLKVTYTKDSIEKSDRHWDALLKKIRGESPIRPNKAQEKGYPINSTAVARLFSGYRKGNKPGFEDLLPGKFNQQKGKWEGNNIEPKVWAELFENEEAEYIDDKKWWELVEQVEEDRRSSGNSTGGDLGGQAWDPTDPGSGSGETEGPDQNDEDQDGHDDGGESSTPEDDGREQENPERLDELQSDSKLSGVYKLDELGEGGVVLNVYINPALSNDKPLLFEKLSHSNYQAQYNPSSQIFTKYNNTVKDYILFELASSFFLRKNDPEEWPLSKIFYNLKAAYSKEESYDYEDIRQQAVGLLNKIRTTISASKYQFNAPPELSTAEYQTLQRNVIIKLGEGDTKVKELLLTTEFIDYMPLNYISRFFFAFPQLFLDGNLFRKPYLEISDDIIKLEIVNEFYTYLLDTLWIVENSGINKNYHLFRRNVESLRVLEEYLNE